MTYLKQSLHALRRDERGLAMVEFALTLPFIVTIMMTATELTNFMTTKMRVSQLALHVSDDGARIGTGDLMSTKQITEAQINDLFIGTNMQSGKLNLATRGRVIMSSLEPDPANANRFRIRWQRCYGTKAYTSAYPYRQGDTNLTGIVINGQPPITAPVGGAVIFVEIAADYQPLFTAAVAPSTQIVETAAMTVRDNREYTGPTGGVGIYNPENVTPSTC